MPSPLHLALGRAMGPAVDARLVGLDADRLPARLENRDVTLWDADPAHRGAILGRLGWLTGPDVMEGAIPALREFARTVAADGFTHAILLGMGGSSLAPEVLRKTLGVGAGGLELTVLDDTAPAAVAAVAGAHDPARTLIVVSSKSGSTIEVVSFERWFHAWQRAARGDDAGRAFVAVTDPGTKLARLAHERGYRRVFAGQPDIGGRYSAISPFGMVPAALIAADLESLVTSARAEVERLGDGRAAREIPGVLLGAVMGELALRGRDKLTLVIEPRYAAVGAWIEQLVAESTGKNGRGIVPVVDEPLLAPDRYGDDRLFVALGPGFESPAAHPGLAALVAAGHPLVAWDPGADGLGAEFVRWEIATATAAAILGVNPFDEPNVAEAKLATQAVLEGYLVAGRFPTGAPRAAGGGLEAHVPDAVVARCRLHADPPSDPAGWLPALLALAGPGDYLALLVYLHRTAALEARLERLREALRGSTRLATTIGYGPRYLHSTGQLHKGGPDTGVFLMMTAEPGEERPIPDERFGFGVLQRAQAEGDYAALERRGRRLLRLHLGRDVEGGLDALIEAVAAAGRL